MRLKAGKVGLILGHFEFCRPLTSCSAGYTHDGRWRDRAGLEVTDLLLEAFETRERAVQNIQEHPEKRKPFGLRALVDI